MQVQGNGKDRELMGLKRKQVVVLPQGSPDLALLSKGFPLLPFPWLPVLDPFPPSSTPGCASQALRAFHRLSLQVSPAFEVEQSVFPRVSIPAVHPSRALTCLHPVPLPLCILKGFWRRQWLWLCLENMF